MYQNYLITGATGFLGSAVVQLLLAHGCRVLALVKDRDPLIYTLPNHVAVFYGDLTDKEAMISAYCTVPVSYPLPQSRMRLCMPSTCRARRTSSTCAGNLAQAG